MEDSARKKQQQELVRRRASVQSGMFTKLLHNRDANTPSRNSGAWIISLTVLERAPPSLDSVRQVVRRNILDKYARFRSRLVLDAQFNAEFDELPLEGLDWDYHVPDMTRDVSVAGGKIKTRADLYAYMGTLNDYEFDLDKPLWRVLVLPPLEDGTSAQVFCVNHALGDGLSLVAVADGLYDEKPAAAPSAAPSPSPSSSSKPPPQQDARPLSLLAKAGIFLFGAYSGATLQFASADPPNRLRLPVGTNAISSKRIAAAEAIPLDKIKEIKTRLQGATVNDVLMALMTLTLKRFFEESSQQDGDGKGGFSPKNKVTAQFPVSMRAVGEGGLDLSGEPHNRISYAYFGFDFAQSSRIHTVWSVKHQIDCIKLSPAPLVLITISRFALSHLPHAFMMDRLAKIGNIGTAQLSNVPASQTQVSAYGGIPVLDMSFFLFSPIAVYLGILTYNNKVNASFNLDSGLGVDPALLAKAWDEEFQLLYSEVMAASPEELKRPTPATAFYKAVALGAVLFVVWLVVLLEFGFKGGVLALAGFAGGVQACRLAKD